MMLKREVDAARGAAAALAARISPAGATSVLGEITRLGAAMLLIGVAMTLAAAELARRAAADDLADFAMVDFLSEDIAPAVDLCRRGDVACLTQVYQNESGGLWTLSARGVTHRSFSYAVSDLAEGVDACRRIEPREVQGYQLYTCLLGDAESFGFRVAERPAAVDGAPAALVALEYASWRAAAGRAGDRLVGGRGLQLAVGVMAVALIVILALTLFAVRRSLARHFGRLGAELDAYRAGDAAGISESYPQEIQGLADSLNRAIEKKSSLMARQRRNVAKMAHDLRHQLVSIDLAARAVSAPDPSTDPAAAQTDLAAELETLGALVDRYLTLSDWVGPAEGAPPAALADALDGARKAFTRRLRETPVVIETACDPGLTARAHPADLRIILANLVGNAHRHAAGRIVLSAAAAPDGGVEIYVDDDGPGIAPADRDRALRWGERLDAAPAGSGFGLALVAEQVSELYGGALNLGTSALGGLRATVRLPR